MTAPLPASRPNPAAHVSQDGPERSRATEGDFASVDLGALPIPIVASEAINSSEVWIGPRNTDPFAMFGPDTTDGGRAEAGWFEIGKLADDGITFKRNPRTEVENP